MRRSSPASTDLSVPPFDPLDSRRDLLQDHLRPQVDRGQFPPTLVDLVRVELELDIEKLEQVEQEQWDVGVCTGGDVGDRGGAADPWVQLPEIHLLRVDIDQHVDLEEAAVTLLAEPVAEQSHDSEARRRSSPVSTSGNISLPHQPPR